MKTRITARITKVTDFVQDDEAVVFASDIVRIPSFVAEDTPEASDD